jgi:isoleucyl-tRNA synthetase
MVPVLDQHFMEQLQSVEELILSEVNVKQLEFLTESSGILVKKIKPDFKALGPKYGKLMKQVASAINQFSQDDIKKLESEGQFDLVVGDDTITVGLEEVEISTEDIPGWLISNVGNLTVALDVTLTDELKQEGIARELVNRIQNLRKDKGFDVTDKITLEVEKVGALGNAIENNFSYICSETLAVSLNLVDKITGNSKDNVELTDEISTNIRIEKAE